MFCVRSVIKPRSFCLKPAILSVFLLGVPRLAFVPCLSSCLLSCAVLRVGSLNGVSRFTISSRSGKSWCSLFLFGSCLGFFFFFVIVSSFWVLFLGSWVLGLGCGGGVEDTWVVVVLLTPGTRLFFVVF